MNYSDYQIDAAITRANDYEAYTMAADFVYEPNMDDDPADIIWNARHAG